MRETMLKLMWDTADGIVRNEAIAMEYVREACIREAAAEQYAANLLRESAREHRVIVLKLQGMLTILRADYVALFHEQPTSRP